MAQKLTESDEMLADVNVIPLADLSLVLLILLMILSPIISQAMIQVNAAKARAAENQQDLATPEIPVIVTDEPGALLLNGIRMGSEMEFVKRLSTLMGTRHDKSVLLTASPLLTEGKVVHVMDLIKRHGADNLIMVKWDAGNAESAAIASLPPLGPEVLR